MINLKAIWMIALLLIMGGNVLHAAVALHCAQYPVAEVHDGDNGECPNSDQCCHENSHPSASLFEPADQLILTAQLNSYPNHPVPSWEPISRAIDYPPRVS